MKTGFSRCKTVRMAFSNAADQTLYGQMTKPKAARCLIDARCLISDQSERLHRDKQHATDYKKRLIHYLLHATVGRVFFFKIGKIELDLDDKN